MLAQLKIRLTGVAFFGGSGSAAGSGAGAASSAGGASPSTAAAGSSAIFSVCKLADGQNFLSLEVSATK